MHIDVVHQVRKKTEEDTGVSTKVSCSFPFFFILIKPLHSLGRKREKITNKILMKNVWVRVLSRALRCSQKLYEINQVFKSASIFKKNKNKKTEQKWSDEVLIGY